MSGWPKPIPDVKVLIPKAIDLVTAAYPGALWLEAEGLPADGELASSAEDIVQWQFVFSTPESQPFLERGRHLWPAAR